jgi:hypothetical protein
MSDFYEIDFLEVHTSKSGDAICVRYELSGYQYIHVIDGGYLATGNGLAQHIDKYYRSPNRIDHVVVTHPDQDHAEGLQVILERYDVQALWMLLPWNYVEELIDRFDRYTSVENLKTKLRKTYPYLTKLEDIAKRHNIPIYEPFQGARIDAFTVLTPTRQRYLDLVVTSAKTPQAAEDSALTRAGQVLFPDACANGQIGTPVKVRNATNEPRPPGGRNPRLPTTRSVKYRFLVSMVSGIRPCTCDLGCNKPQ